MYFKLSFQAKKNENSIYRNYCLINKKISIYKTLTFQISYFLHYFFCFEFNLTFFDYDSNYVNITFMGYSIRLIFSDDRKIYQFINQWSE